MPAGAPPIFYVPMEPFLFYKMRKKGGNKKRVVYLRGGFCSHVCSPEVREHTQAHQCFLFLVNFCT
jgi:hypothetical protein